jgi:5'-nucleotidase
VRFLVDMDGPVVDWDLGWDRSLDAMPAGHGIPYSRDRLRFDVHHEMTEIQSALIIEMMDRPHFYRDLEPVAGAIEGLHWLLDQGHDVSIATSPWFTNPTCASDKLDWMEKHAGPGWASRTIISGDKTVLRGDYLIDDKPNIHGAMVPEWTQIVFDRPVNRMVEFPLRLHSWDRLEELLAQ